MAKKQIDIMAATKKNWYASVDENINYPGDTNIQLGCLQRIAAATEAMAVNYVKLQNECNYAKTDRDNYRERWFAEQRCSAALRGQITKLKKQLNKPTQP